MTRTEAFKLLFALPKSQCFLSSERLDEIEDFNYDELLKYFESLDLPYDFVLRFITDDLDGYASLDNKNYGDDYDYLELRRLEDRSLDLGVWTEVCGNMYFLSEYGKTWKEYERSKKEIEEDEKQHEEWKKLISETFSKIMPMMVSGLDTYTWKTEEEEK